MQKNSPWIGKNCALILAIAVTGCDLHKTVKSADGKLEVKLPIGWVQTTIANSSAKLIVKKSTAREYVSFNTQAKAGLKRLDLKGYAKECMNASAGTSKLKNRIADTPENISMNGKPAIRYRVSGVDTGGNNNIYYHVFFETPTTYVQALCWAESANFERSQGDFDAIMSALVEH